MKSDEGEIVKFRKPVTMKPEVEVWMTEI